MNSFLRKLSQEIKLEYPDPKNLCIILPSRRAGTFLKQELALAYQKTIQAPHIITLDDFVVELSGIKKMDNISCFFELYDCYLQQFTQEEKEIPDELEDFLNWAPNLLADYSEIDQYLVNSISLFSYINDIRAIETWNINGEPLTEQQKSYLLLWKRIGKLYHAFKKHLLAKNEAYAGLIFRQTAENINELSEKPSYEKVLFAGFNAFSTSEKTIVNYLVKTNRAKVYWDADQYYMDDENQEAGAFLRGIKKEQHHQSFSWIGEHFKSSKKDINIYNCNTNFAQSILAASLLEKSKEKKVLENSPEEELQTALVLNKEDLLLPVLNNLPNNTHAANITMGYEVKLTPMANFVKVLLDLWYSNTKSKRAEHSNKKAFYYKNVLQIIEHSYFELLMQDKQAILDLKAAIIKSNVVYVGKQFINNYLNKIGKNEALMNAVFTSKTQNLVENTKKILHILSELKLIFSNGFDSFTNNNSAKEAGKQKKASTTFLNQFDRSLHIEFIYHYTLVFRKMLLNIKQYPALQNCSLKLYKKLISQLVNKEKIAFLGEPLKGIQIMGMLETRALDFKHVILLSVNEGVLPASKKNNSFIPFDVKREFGLPTHKEHDALFANHFYRLLQRAEKIDLIYHTGSDDFGAGTEKSRFIEQLLHEFPAYNSELMVTQHEYNPVVDLQDKENSIVKEKPLFDAVETRLKKGLSPSALNTMISCPLDYYYKYILGLGEQDEIEETMQSSTFGTCIHNTIEQLHQKTLEEEVTPAINKQNKKDAPQILEQEFLNYFKEQELKQGSNLLSFEVAKNYLNKYFSFEQEQLKKGNLTILKVEEELAIPLKISINDQLIAINIKGKIDSVFEQNGQLYILDYKTGNVAPNDLSFKSELDLFKKDSKNNKGKAVQLLCYAWMYYQKHPEVDFIIPCIYSFRNSKAGLLELKFNKRIPSKQEVLELFPKVVQLVLSDFYDNSTAVSHNEKSEYCEYCV